MYNDSPSLRLSCKNSATLSCRNSWVQKSLKHNNVSLMSSNLEDLKNVAHPSFLLRVQQKKTELYPSGCSASRNCSYMSSSWRQSTSAFNSVISRTKFLNRNSQLSTSWEAYGK